jgi:hypothetical protein
MLTLHALAHARTGDKGNISNISVIAYDPGDYAFLCEHVTAARVAAHFAGLVQGRVDRYELPSIGALNFVLHDTLGGGVTLPLARRPRQKPQFMPPGDGAARSPEAHALTRRPGSPTAWV